LKIVNVARHIPCAWQYVFETVPDIVLFMVYVLWAYKVYMDFNDKVLLFLACLRLSKIGSHTRYTILSFKKLI
jgi:hypothetical protein